jgi:hypothetical protein
MRHSGSGRSSKVAVVRGFAIHAMARRRDAKRRQVQGHFRPAYPAEEEQAAPELRRSPRAAPSGTADNSYRY